MRTRKSKIAVGLSGGIDSSVAAALLMEQGHEIIGFFMMIFDKSLNVEASGRHTCYGPGEKEDLESAAMVCKRLGIPFHVVDLKNEYRNHVLDYVRREYLAGRTPNPCVVCNHRLKFGFLLEKARADGLDFDMFATGHYARIARCGDRYLLKTALDPSKDQSYFLYALSQEQLAHTVFPLGTYTKAQARKIAASVGLETSVRPESQDFIAGNGYASLFSRKEMREGDIVDIQGNIIGKHSGIIRYTVGQRKGLGIASGRPLYVLSLDVTRNRVVVSDRKDLFSESFSAGDLNFIAVERLIRPLEVKVKIRLNHQPADASLLPDENERVKVIFKKPQMALAPGQSAVFYLGDTVVGGGTIERTL